MYEELRSRVQLRPIQKWPSGALTPDHMRRHSPFKADWHSTLTMLDRELFNLGAESGVLQVAMDEADFRIDGLPRATARARHPGVILAFNPDGNAAGRMQFATDVFLRWQDNIRAIALGLEALRKVDRYGITSGRQQYAGFRALNSGDDNAVGLYTRDDALRFIDAEWDGDITYAIQQTHPDVGGAADAFRKVMRAKELLKP